MKLFSRIPALLLLLLMHPLTQQAQMITGVWKGRINRQKVEVRIIQKGDSLLGTSYYYESAGDSVSTVSRILCCRQQSGGVVG
ncbi:MAG: hypothetical protein QM781_10265 [Chitinophagaceae bacterium]